MTALLLLGPWTPLLFQGQEFGASTPFIFSPMWAMVRCARQFARTLRISVAVPFPDHSRNVPCFRPSLSSLSSERRKTADENDHPCRSFCRCAASLALATKKIDMEIEFLGIFSLRNQLSYNARRSALLLVARKGTATESEASFANCLAHLTIATSVKKINGVEAPNSWP